MAEKGEYIRQDSSFLATLPVIASCHDSDESTNNYMVQEGQRDSSSPDTMTTIGVEEIVRMEEEEEDIVLLEEGIKTVIQNSDNVIGNYRFSLIESVPETEI